MYDDPKQYSRFPEFVYSWMNTFEYDPKETRIKLL